jgi:hypothetical protein
MEPQRSLLCSLEPSTVPFPRQMNPVNIALSHSSKMHFNIILPYTASLPESLFHSGFLTRIECALELTNLDFRCYNSILRLFPQHQNSECFMYFLLLTLRFPTVSLEQQWITQSVSELSYPQLNKNWKRLVKIETIFERLIQESYKVIHLKPHPNIKHCICISHST